MERSETDDVDSAALGLSQRFRPLDAPERGEQHPGGESSEGSERDQREWARQRAAAEQELDTYHRSERERCPSPRARVVAAVTEAEEHDRREAERAGRRPGVGGCAVPSDESRDSDGRLAHGRVLTPGRGAAVRASGRTAAATSVLTAWRSVLATRRARWTGRARRASVLASRRPVLTARRAADTCRRTLPTSACGIPGRRTGDCERRDRSEENDREHGGKRRSYDRHRPPPWFGWPDAARNRSRSAQGCERVRDQCRRMSEGSRRGARGAVDTATSGWISGRQVGSQSSAAEEIDRREVAADLLDELAGISRLEHDR